MDQQNKLKKFETAVFAEIEAQVLQMQAKAEEFDNEELSRNMDIQLSKAYSEIQSQIQDIRMVLKREVATFSLSNKRNILERRNELVENMFKAISKRLSEYTQTTEYKERLVKKIKAFSNENPLSDVKIFVGKSDFADIEAIKKAYALPCTVCENDAITLGGFIVRDDASHYYFDETLETKLFEKRADFAQTGKLSLEQ